MILTTTVLLTSKMSKNFSDVDFSSLKKYNSGNQKNMAQKIEILKEKYLFLKPELVLSSDKIALLTGNANKPLAREIGRILSLDLNLATGRFPDGEVRINGIEDSLTNKDVFIIQPTSPTKDRTRDSVLELMFIVDTCIRGSAKNVTAVIPYYGYSRQDRKNAPRTPISAATIGRVLEALKVNRIITVDLHAEQSEGSFYSPWDNLYSSKILLEEVKALNLNNPCVVSADYGNDRRTIAWAKKLGLDPQEDTATVIKRRDSPEHSEAKYIKGNVSSRDCLIVDDLTNTLGTLDNAARISKENGAERVIAVVTHALLIKEAKERLDKSPIEKLIITDTVAQPSWIKNHPKIQIISIAPLLAEAIRRTHLGLSFYPELID